LGVKTGNVDALDVAAGLGRTLRTMLAGLVAILLIVLVLGWRARRRAH